MSTAWISRRFPRLIPALVLGAGVAWFAPAVQGQVFVLPAQEAQNPVETDEEELPNAQQNVVFGGIDESNFEAWIWNGAVNNAEGGKARLKSQLDLLVAEIGRACQLKPAQQLKLQLAGGADIKRFFERYMKLRKKFLMVRNDPNGMNNFWAELQPLQLEIQAGLFGEESLLLRVIPQTLDTEQRAIYDRETAERRRYRIEAKLELLLVAADESLGLRIEQREKLTALCKSRLRVPKRFGQYDSYVIMYELSRIPEADVRAILNDEQWKGWTQAMAQGRGMEQFLRQNKLLGEDDAPADAVAPQAVNAIRIFNVVPANQPAEEQPAGDDQGEKPNDK